MNREREREQWFMSGKNVSPLETLNRFLFTERKKRTRIATDGCKNKNLYHDV